MEQCSQLAHGYSIRKIGCQNLSLHNTVGELRFKRAGPVGSAQSGFSSLIVVFWMYCLSKDDWEEYKSKLHIFHDPRVKE